MTRVDVLPRARAQIRLIDEWWRSNRDAAPSLFAEELTYALERLGGARAIGALYDIEAPSGVRRMLLRKTRYHLYYSVDDDADVISVLAVWHAKRGSGPLLL